MRIACVFLLMMPAAAWGVEDKVPAEGVQESQEPERCDIRLNIGWFAIQDVAVKPGRVVGPDFNLHIEGDVVYGFIRGKASRFKVRKDEVSGSAAGFDLMLHVIRSETVTEIRGLVGNRRVVARVSDEKIAVNGSSSSVVSSSSSLSVTKVRAGYFRGHVGGGADLQFADMTLKGCDLSIIKNRPDLIVALFMCWLGA